MQREYTKTFLGIISDDIEDFVTIRRRFDNPLEYRLSIGELTHLIFTNENQIKSEETKNVKLIEEKEIIENEIKEISESNLLNTIIVQSEKIISFPYQSFLNLRYWHKSPKSLKIFFQALSCLFYISNKNHFLTELKMNKNILEFNQPSAHVMDEYRIRFSNLKEISPEYIRKKSSDAYLIALWMENIEENERLNRLQQPEIENKKRLEEKLIQLKTNLIQKQKEIQFIEDKIKKFKNTIDQIEKHRQALV